MSDPKEPFEVMDAAAYESAIEDGTMVDNRPLPITFVDNHAMSVYRTLYQAIRDSLHQPIELVGNITGTKVDYEIPEMTVQEMFGVDGGNFVFIAKTMGQSTQPWNNTLVERARTVEIGSKLLDARHPSGEVLVTLHCYEHVYNGTHDIELVVQKHKYFEWIADWRHESWNTKRDEVVTLSHRYLCTGLVGELPPTCKYPPPHIPSVR